MADFALVADIEAFLQVEISSDPVKTVSAQAALRDASAAIRNYTRQFLELVEDEKITLDSGGGPRIYLPELPVVEVSSVVEDGDALTDQDDFKLGQFGILHRIGKRWKSGIQIIEIIYSHGYTTIPDDLISVCVRAASRFYQAGLKAAVDEAIPGIASKSLGDFSVSYSGDASSNDGLMGASGARFLLYSEKDILNRYRVKGP